MGLLDRFRRQEERPVQNSAVNERSASVGYGNFRLAFGSKRYADAYLWMILTRIFSGMRNVRFFVDSRRDPKELMPVYAVMDFIEANFANLIWLYWSYGYIVIGRDARGKYVIPDYTKLRKDVHGNIVGDYVTYYSETYRFALKSHFDLIRENVGNLDTIKNGQDYLTRSLGALGILSSKSAPMFEEDKDEMNRTLKRKYGIREDQFQILLFDTDVNYQQMSLPIKDLELAERIKDEIKLIAGFFHVPYDLIPFAGQSTYANQEQAVRVFYSDCISTLAEVALAVGRQCIKDMKTLLIPSSVLTFKIDNVSELEDDRTATIEYKIKVAKLIKTMKESGLDTTQYEEQLTNRE